MTLLLTMSMARIYLLFHVQMTWPYSRVDMVLCALLCLSFGVLVGLFWSKMAPAWSQIIFGLTPILPTLQVVCLVISHDV